MLSKFFKIVQIFQGGKIYGSTTQSHGNELQQNAERHDLSAGEVDAEVIQRLQGKHRCGRRGRLIDQREDAPSGQRFDAGVGERAGRYQLRADGGRRVERSY